MNNRVNYRISGHLPLHICPMLYDNIKCADFHRYCMAKLNIFMSQCSPFNARSPKRLSLSRWCIFGLEFLPGALSFEIVENYYEQIILLSYIPCTGYC